MIRLFSTSRLFSAWYWLRNCPCNRASLFPRTLLRSSSSLASASFSSFSLRSSSSFHLRSSSSHFLLSSSTLNFSLSLALAVSSAHLRSSSARALSSSARILSSSALCSSRLKRSSSSCFCFLAFSFSAKLGTYGEALVICRGAPNETPRFP